MWNIRASQLWINCHVGNFHLWEFERFAVINAANWQVAVNQEHATLTTYRTPWWHFSNAWTLSAWCPIHNCLLSLSLKYIYSYACTLSKTNFTRAIVIRNRKISMLNSNTSKLHMKLLTLSAPHGWVWVYEFASFIFTMTDIYVGP